MGLNRVWPMAIIMRALTSTDDHEIAGCLKQLIASTANTGLMHESFNIESTSDFSRPCQSSLRLIILGCHSAVSLLLGFAWANSLFGCHSAVSLLLGFAWANSLFGSLIFKLAKERPHLIIG